MIRFSPTTLAALLTLIAAPALADSAKRIVTKAEFVKSVTERPLSSGMGQVTIHADGTASGRAGPIKISGVWHWRGGLFCRYMVVAGNKTKPDCQVVKLSGNGKILLFVANQGNGKTKRYKFK